MKKIVTFILILQTISAGLSFACSCTPKSVQEYFTQADIVFTGEVLELSKEGEYGLKATLKPLKLYKGMYNKILTVMTIDRTKAPGLCGYSFAKNEKVLVYGNGNVNTDAFSTDICRGTKSLSDAQEDLKELEKGFEVLKDK